MLSFDIYNRPTSIKGSAGLVRFLEYDAKGRLISSSADGNVTSFEYDAVGNAVRVTMPDGSYLSYNYDDARRMTGVTDVFGNKTEYSHDAAGNVVGENVYDLGNTLKRSQARVFDELGRLIRSIGGDNEAYAFAYDLSGNREFTIDSLQRESQSSFDGLNRLSQVKDALNGVTSLSYNKAGQTESVVDPRGVTTTYDYNGFGERVAVHSPDSGFTTHEFDKAGNATNKTDANGVVIRYVYDALNRLVSEVYPDASLNIAYNYDQGLFGVGRLSGFTDASGSTSYEYDIHGNIALVSRTIESSVYISKRTFDAANHLSSASYPSGRIINYARDAAGRVSTVTISFNGETTSLANNIEYLPFGPMNRLEYGNGLTLNQEFDKDYRIVSQSVPGVREVSIGYDAVSNIDSLQDSFSVSESQLFGYDYLDRLTSASGSYGVLDYTYDGVGNRLTENKDGLQDNYQYGLDSNQLLSVSGTRDVAYDLDAAGNTIGDSNHSYTFNDRNRLSLVDGGETATYGHNAIGQRVLKVSEVKSSSSVCADLNGDGVIDNLDVRSIAQYRGVDINGDGRVTGRDVSSVARSNGKGKNKGKSSKKIPGKEVFVNSLSFDSVCASDSLAKGSTHFIYNLSGQLIGEYRSDGSLSREYVWLDGLLLAVLDNSGMHFIHTDHLGSPRAVTSASGVTVWRWESDPFGSILPNEDVDGDGEAFVLNLRFPGQYYDAESGLHYNYFRTYDPELGRYITSDPIGLGGGLNTYMYVEGNPLGRIDPTGEATILNLIIGACAVGLTYYGIDASVRHSGYALDNTERVVDAISKFEQCEISDSCSHETEMQYREDLTKIPADTYGAIGNSAHGFASALPGNPAGGSVPRNTDDLVNSVIVTTFLEWIKND